MSSFFKARAEKLLSLADVRIGGERPWDMTVHDDRLYRRAMLRGSLGLGKSYMDGWWDVPKLDQFFTKVLTNQLEKKTGRVETALLSLSNHILNRQSKRRAFQVGERHYDIGNDLYRAMLDPRLTYTCGYWREADTLAAAQEAKLDLICRKLNLQPGQHILDIGCGWGSFAKYAAEKYGVRVTGVTVSQEQVALAQKLCAGLPVEFVLCDYRDIRGQFDHIVSVGMFEHVGYKNYRTFMRVVRKHLKDDGLFLLHTIGHSEATAGVDPWTDKYIFPNGMMPSIKQLSTAVEGLFVMEDWHNFGADYDTTLMAWHHNFNAHWPELQKHYDERFFRMWNYYLLMSAASFRTRDNQLWQIVLSKHGVKGGYLSVR